ncbi:hypothetical protein ACHAWF_014046 [Thalassiosira exigua]
MLNYHELTMNEPRDSPQRRKQFLVISLIVAGMTLHAGLTAGILAPLAIERGSFPGGEFVHKFMTKDYAASTGTSRTVADDLGVEEEGGGGLVSTGLEEVDTADMLYTVFFDDAAMVPGGKTRFASGVLLPGGKKDGGATIKQRLLVDANERIDVERKLDGKTKKQREEEDFGSIHSKDVKYDAGKLPKVDAAVVRHPFTAGAWSAIFQSHKIMPKLKEYAEGEEGGGGGGDLVVVSTCSASQGMCTYYMPLSKRDKFYMGKETTEEYAKQFEGASMWEFMGVSIGGGGEWSIGGFNLGNVFRGAKRALGMGGNKKGGSAEGEL